MKELKVQNSLLKVQIQQVTMAQPSVWGGLTMAALIFPLFLAALSMMHTSQAGKQEEVMIRNRYAGPEFSAFNCYKDQAPVRYRLPDTCVDETGGRRYKEKAKYQKHSVNLYQTLETFDFDAKFCVLEESTQDFLCGWQSWGELLSPPKVGAPKLISPTACKQMWSRKLFTDSSYGKTFPIEEGVNHFAYQARGSLQVSGESVYCSGNTGRISTGELVQKSMVFKSIRLTLGRLKGRREFKDNGNAVITQGELTGTEIVASEVTGRSVIMGQVTILLGSNFFKSQCPLAAVRKDLVMFQVPNPSSSGHKLTARPGDRMYGALHDTEQELGTPNLEPWVLLLSQASDLVINLGREYSVPSQCMLKGKFYETSHAHIVAALEGESEEKEMSLLPLDLELVSASDYSARLDLLSYLTSVSLEHLQKKEQEDVCLGDPKQVFTALRRSEITKGIGRRRYLTAGEMIVQAQCEEVQVGFSLLEGAREVNCTAMIPVREISEDGVLQGPQWWLAPSTRYLSRTPVGRHCEGFQPAFRDTEGIYWQEVDRQLARVQPQPRTPLKIPSLQPDALPDLIDSVAGGQDIYTAAQREQVMEELDFSIFVQGPSYSTTHVVQTDSGGRPSASAGSSSRAGILPGWSAGKEYLESGVGTPIIYLWNHLGAPLFHFLVTLGSLFGLWMGLSGIFNSGLELLRLIRIGGSLRGESYTQRGADLLSLGISSARRQARIREAETGASEKRILYSIAKSRGSRVNLGGLQSSHDLADERDFYTEEA